jgi:beta-1,2-mannosidase
MINNIRVFILRFWCIAILASCSQSGSDETWAMTPFLKVDEANPILEPIPNSYFTCPVRNKLTHWEQKDVFNPAAVVRDGKVYLLYRAEDTVGRYAGTSRIGLAVSTDGLHFARKPQPVLFPQHDEFTGYEWEGGCEDPRIVEDEQGMYYMTYSAYDGDKSRLMIATSKNLINWTKRGPAFQKTDGGNYVDRWTKSGSIVTRMVNDKLIATRINDKYWMYFGDTDIYAATSDNLIDWTPLTQIDSDDFNPVFSPRQGLFDSDLVEPGPPAILTKDGILLLYNSRNRKDNGDPDLPPGTYAAGQILLDPNDPSKVLNRIAKNFFQPSKPYEINGQVNNVCFLEGLVHFQDKWFLYYGTADSKIAVATYSND